MRPIFTFILLLSGQVQQQVGQDPGTALVTYEVDGSVHTAALTYRDAAATTKQKVVTLPYKDQFTVSDGAFVYLSAQKRPFKKVDRSYVNPREETVDDGRAGKLHVFIRIGGVVTFEAETTEPFGIATASGKAERR